VTFDPAVDAKQRARKIIKNEERDPTDASVEKCKSETEASEEARTLEETSDQVRLCAAGLKSFSRPVGIGLITRVVA
jgi:hypothetical protein